MCNCCSPPKQPRHARHLALREPSFSFLYSYCRDKTPLVVDEIKWYVTLSFAKARSTHIMISSGVSTPPCGRSDLQHEWESERWNRTTLERERLKVRMPVSFVNRADASSEAERTTSTLTRLLQKCPLSSSAFFHTALKDAQQH